MNADQLSRHPGTVQEAKAASRSTVHPQLSIEKMGTVTDDVTDMNGSSSMAEFSPIAVQTGASSPHPPVQSEALDSIDSRSKSTTIIQTVDSQIGLAEFSQEVCDIPTPSLAMQITPLADTVVNTSNEISADDTVHTPLDLPDTANQVNIQHYLLGHSDDNRPRESNKQPTQIDLIELDGEMNETQLEQTAFLEPPLGILELDEDMSPPVSFSTVLNNSGNSILEAQQADEGIQIVKQGLIDDSIPLTNSDDDWVNYLCREFPNLLLNDDGLVYRKPPVNKPDEEDPPLQVLVPRKWVGKVLSLFHGSPTSGHFGHDVACKAAKRICYWPQMAKDFIYHCKSCEPCLLLSNPTPKYKAPLGSLTASRPLERVTTDITELPITSNGYRYVLTANDVFTKYIKLYPLKNITAKDVARCLFDDYVSNFGCPGTFHSDQGGQYQSVIIQDLCRIYDIIQTNTTPYHPSGNPTAERINRTIKAQLAKKLLENYGAEWDQHLRQVEFAYNTKIHSTTKQTPFFLFYGREANLPANLLLGIATPAPRAPTFVSDTIDKVARARTQALANIDAAHERNSLYYNRNARMGHYPKGSKVYLQNMRRKNKLEPTYLGPYTVLDHTDDGKTYKISNLDDPSSKVRIVHHDKLLPPHDPNKYAPTPSGYTGIVSPPSQERPLHPGNEIVPPPPPRPPDGGDIRITLASSSNIPPPHAPPSTNTSPSVSPPSFTSFLNP